MKEYSALVVDDDVTIVELITNMLKKTELKTIYRAYDGKEAIKMFLDVKPDVVFADFIMEEIDGITLLKVVKVINPTIPVVIFTGYYDRLYKRLLQEDFRPEYLIQKPSLSFAHIKDALYSCLPDLKKKR